MDGAPIVAIATAPGRGAVGIVRISGPTMAPLCHALLGRELPARSAVYGPFLDESGLAIDHGIAIRFPAPHSYTGEEVLELQAHGGPVVLQMLVRRCLQAGAGLGLRLARPGEFTERAFLNGKLDLAQAEAVADLIDAGSEAAARAATRSLEGAMAQAVDALRKALVALRMQVEAALDFPEEDTHTPGHPGIAPALQTLRHQVQEVLERARQGARLRDGLHVVIAGEPNAGKSSLLNALAGVERAIVTPIAGTTRDPVREDILIDGLPLHVVDTAGLRDSSDPVERIGIDRAWRAIERADVVLLVHDHTRRRDPDFEAVRHSLLARIDALVPPSVPRIEIWNKSDLGPPQDLPAHGLALSARHGQGLDELRSRLRTVGGWQALPDGAFLARERHVQALREVAQALDAASAQAAAPSPAMDLVAEDLRGAQQALNRITGAFDADDLLGEIFARFCIGK